MMEGHSKQFCYKWGAVEDNIEKLENMLGGAYCSRALITSNTVHTFCIDATSIQHEWFIIFKRLSDNGDEKLLCERSSGRMAVVVLD